MILDLDYIIKPRMAEAGATDFSVPRIWHKDAEGNVWVEELPERPYCYLGLLPADVKLPFRPLKVEHTERIIGERMVPLLKVTVPSTGHVVGLREWAQDSGIPVYEADVPFHTRILIDRQLTPFDEQVPLRVASLDFEMFAEKGFPKATRDPIAIAALAWRDELGRVQSEAICVPAPGYESEYEERVLRTLVLRLKQINPDVVVTYNGNRFDWPYLLARAALRGVQLDLGRDGSDVGEHPRFREPICAGRHLLDLLPVVQRDVDNVKVKTLKNVCDALGIRKTTDRVMIEGRQLAAEWKANPANVMRYARDDAEDTLVLGETLIAKLLPLCRISRARLTEMAHAKRGRQIEHYIMAVAAAEGRVIPPIGGFEEDRTEDEDDYDGAFVFDPPVGIVRDIRVIDVAGMYPTIMIKHNISPETLCLNLECGRPHQTVPGVGHRFHTDARGFMSRMVEALVAMKAPLKKKLKGLKQGTPEYTDCEAEYDAVKKLGNGSYGLQGWTGSRWFKRECAESITSWGQHYIKTAAQMAKDQFGIDHIYGDTDSLFLRQHPRIDEFIALANATFPVTFEDEDPEGRPCPIGLFPAAADGDGAAKKRYALLKADGTMKIRGFETRRGDWCNLAKRIQEKLLDLVLKVEDVKGAVQLVRQTIIDLKARRVPVDDLTIFKSVKPMDEYRKPPAYAVAALRQLGPADYADVENTKVGFVVVPVRGSKTLTDRLRVLDLAPPGGYTLDPDYYIEKQLIPSSLRILSTFRLNGSPITEDFLRTGYAQTGLEAW